MPSSTVAHDAYTRLLHHLEPDAARLWQEVQELVWPTDGVSVLDDTTLDKSYARHMGLVTRHWLGKHRRLALLSGVPARRTSKGATEQKNLLRQGLEVV